MVLRGGFYFVNPYQSQADCIQDVMNELGSECPVIVLNTKNLQIVPGSARQTKDLQSGGFQFNADMSFTMLVSTLAAAGVADNASDAKDALLQREIGYLDDRYKVKAVNIIAGALFLGIEADSLNQRP